MGKELIPDKILWLASYPKSGNTWFRAFLSALINDGNVEINKMATDGILSSRQVFDNITDLDSRDLYDTEVKNLLPGVYRQYAIAGNKMKIVKVHDAYHTNQNGDPIIPTDVTHAAIYIIRNPLDVVASFAHHSNITIDKTIQLMNNEKGVLVRQKNNHNTSNQFPQLMYDWSGHVNSWTTPSTFPVHIVRYEDMLEHPMETFSNTLEKIGWDYPTARILHAIEATSFKKLKKQETEIGFKEKTFSSDGFFRQGKAGNWVNELTKEQSELIIEAHGDTMANFGYL